MEVCKVDHPQNIYTDYVEQHPNGKTCSTQFGKKFIYMFVPVQMIIIIHNQQFCTYYLLLLFIFIHSATNVTLDIPFTSYITSLTYKHY